MQAKEKLIQKLFSNQCTDRELHLLFQLIREDEGETSPEIMMELFRQMKQVPELDEKITERIFDKITAATGETERAASFSLKDAAKKPTSKPKGRKLFWHGSAAASTLLLFAASWFFQQSNGENHVLEQTAYNEIREVLLPDSSIVTLNGNSSINYSLDWSADETRVVSLEGEAYFKVKPKPATKAKFQVVTKDLTVEVLGTAFNVNTHHTETTVFLEEGKVKINLEDEKETEMHLKPGEVLHYSAQQKVMVAPQKIASETQTSWKTGMQKFDDIPLKEILQKLAATNNLEFKIEGEGLAATKFDMTLPIEDIDLAMNLLSKTTGTEVSKNGNQFIISAKK